MTDTNVAERLRELGSGEITACIEDAAKVYDMRAACRDAAALIDSLQRERGFQNGVHKVAVDALQRDLDAARIEIKRLRGDGEECSQSSGPLWAQIREMAADGLMTEPPNNRCTVGHGYLLALANAVERQGRDLDAATERARQAELKYQNEYSIVDRIWRLFGSPSYEELKGRSIYDLVEGEQKRAEELRAECETWRIESDELEFRLERVAAERDAAVAQQAAMAEELRRYTADHDCDAEDGRGCSRCGRSESEAKQARSVRALLTSVSPRAKQLLAVMAANAKWHGALRASPTEPSPIDWRAEREGFAELKRALDALHTEEVK